MCWHVVHTVNRDELVRIMPMKHSADWCLHAFTSPVVMLLTMALVGAASSRPCIASGHRISHTCLQSTARILSCPDH
jgi:hypothetical protein